MDHFWLQLVASFSVGLIGVAVGWGIIQTKVATNEERIKEINEWRRGINGVASQPSAYVRRYECVEKVAAITREMARVDHRLDEACRAVRGLQNYARWQLTTKEGKSPAEAEEIIEGS